LVLPFWYQLTRVVLDKGPPNGCVCMEAISREFRVVLLWELLYADDLAVIAETEDELIKRLNEWKDNMKSI